MERLLHETVECELNKLLQSVYWHTIAGYAIMAILAAASGGFLLGMGDRIGWLGLAVGIGVTVSGHCNARLAVIQVHVYSELLERIVGIEQKSDRTKRKLKEENACRE